jgi:hypothetical protein
MRGGRGGRRERDYFVVTMSVRETCNRSNIDQLLDFPCLSGTMTVQFHQNPVRCTVDGWVTLYFTVAVLNCIS